MKARQQEYATRRLVEQSARLRTGDRAVVPEDQQVDADDQREDEKDEDKDDDAVANAVDRADEDECDMLKEAFASWKCLGRFHNALGPEWREQGGAPPVRIRV